jgi:acyl dehydratase
MALPSAKHLRHQLPVLASLGGTAMAAVRQQLFNGGAAAGAMPSLPSPEIRMTLQPRAPDLVRDYVRHVGGDPGSYRNTIPPHLFPQWGFPLAAKTLRGLPYPMARVLNGGCRLEINSPLPLGEPLDVSARLVDIDDNGRRAVLKSRIVTGTRGDPEALVGLMYAIVPLGGGKGNGAAGGASNPAESARPAKKERARVPQDARELGYWKLPANAGLAFAMLTGDFNPVHWVPPYARASGFRSTILHGFSTMARAIEGLNRGLFAGDTTRLRSFDCKFTRPLLLPNTVGLYVDGADVYVGDAPGGSAYLTGSFTTDSEYTV